MVRNLHFKKKVSEDNRVGGQRRTTNQQGHAAPRHWNRSPDSSKETDTSNKKKGLRQRLNCVNLLVLFTRKSNQRQHFYSAFKWWRTRRIEVFQDTRASQKKHMIIVKVVPNSTRGRSEMEPRGTIMAFVSDRSAFPDKNSVWAGIEIKMFGGVFGRDKVTCGGNDAGSWVGLSTSVAKS